MVGTRVIDDPAAVRALFQPLRRRIWDHLRAPRSVRDLSEELRVPADRLYYHLELLRKHGLVEVVAVRRRGRHKEKLYTRSHATVRFSGNLDVRGTNPLGAISDELSGALLAPDAADAASVSYHRIRLSAARAAELSGRLRELIAEYEAREDHDGRVFGVLGVLAPVTSRDDVVIRELGPEELEFLHDMLIAALAWRPGVALPARAEVLEHPQVRIFHEGWGRPGDVALVAEHSGVRVGLVWFRLFTDASHGEGYVDDETPEIAIATLSGHRGRGIGRALLLAAHERARRDGIARLSLSVDEGNPARRLYESLGYRDFEPTDGLGRMTLNLDSSPTPDELGLLTVS